MSIVVIGSVAYDTISTPHGVAERVLGGSASYFSLAARFFAPVKIVAAVGEDFAEEHVEMLRGCGVDTSGLTRAAGPTFHWRGEYKGDMNEAHTLDTQLGVFATFRPRLTEDQSGTPNFFLANIDPDLQLEILDQARGPRLVAMDTMNYWITGKPESLRKVLARVDILLINDGESRLLSGVDNILKAAREIRAMGPKTLVLKRGEYGVLVFHESGLFAAPAYPLERVFDPTGAGDSFAGGFVGYLAASADLSPKAMRKAAVYGAAVASFTCEEFSVNRLVRLTRAEIDERFEWIRELTRF